MYDTLSKNLFNHHLQGLKKGIFSVRSDNTHIEICAVADLGE